jgi:hypothetical protein
MPGHHRGSAVLVVRAWRDEAPEPTFRARVTQVFDVPPDESLDEVLGAESVIVCSSPGQLARVLDRWLMCLVSPDR